MTRRRKKHRPDEIVAKLHGAEAMLNESTAFPRANLALASPRLPMIFLSVNLSPRGTYRPPFVATTPESSLRNRPRLWGAGRCLVA
jgi:hypothetical protein